LKVVDMKYREQHSPKAHAEPGNDAEALEKSSAQTTKREESHVRGDAVISDCGRYRYLLWRSWGPDDSPRAVFLMLNPSTAGAKMDDPTIRKCIGFARRWGCGGLDVVNLFAWRATDPRELARLSMLVAVGDRNADYIAHAMRPGSTVVCAWGSCGNAAVKKMVRERLVVVKKQLRLLAATQCLGRAVDGNPRHPLMLGYGTQLEPWCLT
jgi:hypothetical protein